MTNACFINSLCCTLFMRYRTDTDLLLIYSMRKFFGLVSHTYPSSYGSTPSSPPSLEHPNCELIPSYSYSSFCQYGSAVVQWYLVNICWCGVQAINWFWVLSVPLSVSLATSPCLRHYLAIIEKDPLTQPERTFCNFDIQHFCIFDPVITLPVWKGINKAEMG